MRRSLVLLWLACLGTVGCDAESDATRLAVFAASSLTDVFRALEADFEAAHSDIDLTLTFSGSQVLRLQVEQGASADVFASANEDHMRALVEAGEAAEPLVFATTDLVVIVPHDNPAGVERFEDVSSASRIVIGTDRVPIGVYTRSVLANASGAIDPDGSGPAAGDSDFATAVFDRVVSMEHNVRLVRAKVELGEADAGIVYRSDAVASDRVLLVSIPDSLNVRARFPIAITTRTKHPIAARRFLDYLSSPEAARVLMRHGFRPGPA